MSRTIWMAPCHLILLVKLLPGGGRPPTTHARRISSPATIDMFSGCLTTNGFTENQKVIMKFRIKLIYNIWVQSVRVIRGLFICNFAYLHWQHDNFLVKNGLFICKFRIRGPKWWNISTANNEGNLYVQLILSSTINYNWIKKSNFERQFGAIQMTRDVFFSLFWPPTLLRHKLNIIFLILLKVFEKIKILFFSFNALKSQFDVLFECFEIEEMFFCEMGKA